MILAIDPGPSESAYVLWDGSRIADFGKVPNAEMLSLIRSEPYRANHGHLVIEMIACYGMAVGAEVFETCVWIGRFIERADRRAATFRLTRNQVKNHLCHSSKANDSNIRQAIIDRFGGKAAAIGKKATPGPLYGVSGDVWAALAVALTWSDQRGALDVPGAVIRIVEAK